MIVIYPNHKYYMSYILYVIKVIYNNEKVNYHSLPVSDSEIYLVKDYTSLL